MATLAELKAKQQAPAVNTEDSKKTVDANIVFTNNNILERINKVMKGKSRVIHFDVDMVKDQDWVAETPFVNGYNLDSEVEDRRYWSTADRKFEDTTLGGNYVCNARPGYTPYADVPKPGLLDRNVFSPISRADNLGMGPYYSEAHDDSYQVLDLRFGKPEYNSLPGFFSSFYSAKDALLANSGVYSPAFYGIGQVAGTAAMFMLLGPMAAVTILAVSWIGGFVQGILLTNPHKFYYVRPTMSLYWRAVHNIVKDIMSFKGVYTGNSDNPITGERNAVEQDVLSQLQTAAPGIFDSKTGAINVARIINRAERINQRLQRELKSVVENAGSYEALLKAMDRVRTSATRNPAGMTDGEYGQKYADAVAPENPDKMTIATLMSGTMEERYGDMNSADREKEMQKPYSDSIVDKIKSKASKFMELMEAELSDGSAFATFRVDHTGPVNESFSHSTMKNDLGEKFNDMSAKGRAAHFTFAGGNVLPGADEVLGAVKAMVGGALAAVKLDGLLSLAGSSYVDIPENWENAAYQAPSMNYSMRLVSPYGHPLAQLQHIYIPLAMILAGVMPHAAGRSAYTQPFLCEAYDRGRGIVRTGLISQVSITRGVSNLGFTKNKDALAIDVQFTIKDLSSVLYMPLEAGMNLDPKNSIHTYDTAYSDYMAVLGSATLSQNIYTMAKLKVRARQWVTGVAQYTTMDHWAGFIRDLPGVRLMDMFYPDSGRGN